MKYLKQKFTHYSLCYYANDSDDCIAKINCYIENQEVKRILGIVYSPVFTIKFFKNNSEIPPNKLEKYKFDYDENKLLEKYGPVKRINLHYPISQFNDILSILRHEKKPLYLFIGGDKDNLKGGLLTKVPIDDNEYKDIKHYYD